MRAPGLALTHITTQQHSQNKALQIITGSTNTTPNQVHFNMWRAKFHFNTQHTHVTDTTIHLANSIQSTTHQPTITANSQTSHSLLKTFHCTNKYTQPSPPDTLNPFSPDPLPSNHLPPLTPMKPPSTDTTSSSSSGCDTVTTLHYNHDGTE